MPDTDTLVAVLHAFGVVLAMLATFGAVLSTAVGADASPCYVRAPARPMSAAELITACYHLGLLGAAGTRRQCPLRPAAPHTPRATATRHCPLRHAVWLGLSPGDGRVVARNANHAATRPAKLHRPMRRRPGNAGLRACLQYAPSWRSDKVSQSISCHVGAVPNHVPTLTGWHAS